MAKKREEIEQEEEIDREAMLDELFNDKYYNVKKEKKSGKKKKEAEEAETDEATGETAERYMSDEAAEGSDSDTDETAERYGSVDTDERYPEGKTSEEDEDAEASPSEKKKKKEKNEKRKSRKKNKKPDEINIVKDLFNLLCYILAVVIICWGVLTFVGQRTEVSGDSMNDTLKDGDSLWIDKLTYRFNDPERYDIIVFPYSDDTYYIKRIIGLPGETVYIDEDGVIYINDEPLTDDIYGKETIEASKRGVASEPITLGEDEYFVMGDNRNNSRDSRIADVGNITLDQIEGKAVFRLSGGFGKIE